MRPAYDARRKRAVLYGGTTDEGAQSDTWEFDGTTWAEVVTDGGPGPRVAPVLAFDRRAGLVVLFGGQDAHGRAQADIWTYDGRAWTLRYPNDAPIARSHGAAAYDATRGRILVYGGLDLDGRKSPDQWDFYLGSGLPEEACDSDGDEDLDGSTDCTDPDCSGAEGCEPFEDCRPGVTDDIDGDGLAGCADPNCGGLPCGDPELVCRAGACGCPTGDRESRCSDGLDDDCDGLVDCEDDECLDARGCSS